MDPISKRCGRCEKHGLFVLMGLLAFIVSACQVNVSFGKPVEAIAASAVPTQTATAPPPTASPTPSPTATETPILATDTPVPTPTETPLPPTPSPTPLPPAQSPPDKIIIPAIGLTAPVTETTWTVETRNGQNVSVWHVPDFAAGWHVNSALPGHGSNVVLSGHHNIKGEVFRHLVELQRGDTIELHADGRVYYYTVSDRFIIPERGVPEEQRRQNARWIMPTTDERLTLVTCYPYTDNSHRVIVIAKPVANPTLAKNLP